MPSLVHVQLEPRAQGRRLTVPTLDEVDERLGRRRSALDLVISEALLGHVLQLDLHDVVVQRLALGDPL
eukprot:9076124-Pyramimonas_sp.AAC.1